MSALVKTSVGVAPVPSSSVKVPLSTSVVPAGSVLVDGATLEEMRNFHSQHQLLQQQVAVQHQTILAFQQQQQQQQMYAAMQQQQHQQQQQQQQQMYSMQPVLLQPPHLPQPPLYAPQPFSVFPSPAAAATPAASFPPPPPPITFNNPPITFNANTNGMTQITNIGMQPFHTVQPLQALTPMACMPALNSFNGNMQAMPLMPNGMNLAMSGSAPVPPLAGFNAFPSSLPASSSFVPAPPQTNFLATTAPTPPLQLAHSIRHQEQLDSQRFGQHTWISSLFHDREGKPLSSPSSLLPPPLCHPGVTPTPTRAPAVPSMSASTLASTVATSASPSTSALLALTMVAGGAAESDVTDVSRKRKRVPSIPNDSPVNGASGSASAASAAIPLPSPLDDADMLSSLASEALSATDRDSGSAKRRKRAQPTKELQTSSSGSTSPASNNANIKPFSFSKANLTLHAKALAKNSDPQNTPLYYHPNSHHASTKRRGVGRDGDDDDDLVEDDDGGDAGAGGASSRSRYCLPCPLVLHLPKVPLQTLYLQVQKQYTISKKEMESRHLSAAAREELVSVPVRIMGSPNDLSQLYFVAKDVCLLVFIRKGNVAKCWSRGTPLLLYDGRVKPVELIRAGDQLMGPDSTPRSVLPGSVFRGNTKMDEQQFDEDETQIAPIRASFAHRQTEVEGQQLECKFEGCQHEFESVSERDAHESDASAHLIPTSLPPAMYRVSSSNSTRLSFSCNGDHILMLQFLTKPTPIIERRDSNITRPFLFTTLVAEAGRVHEKRHTFRTRDDANDAHATATRDWQPLMWQCTVNQFMQCQSHIQQQALMYQPDAIHFPPTDRTLQQRVEALWDKTSVTDEMIASTARKIGVAIAGGEVDKDGRFQQLIHSYELELDHKQFPLPLLSDSVSVRCSLLGGVFDASSCLCVDSYSLPSPDSAYLTGLLHLMRGLGINTRRIEEATGDMRLHIDAAQIKEAGITTTHDAKHITRTIEHDTRANRCDAFTIDRIEHDDYYGFTLDGDGQCMLGDFVVSHNSIGQFDTTEKARLPVLCPRSNGTSSTHVLTALSLAGVKRLLGASKSPLAAHLLKFLLGHIETLAAINREKGAEATPEAGFATTITEKIHVKTIENDGAQAEAEAGAHDEEDDENHPNSLAAAVDRLTEEDDDDDENASESSVAAPPKESAVGGSSAPTIFATITPSSITVPSNGVDPPTKISLE